jgi:hypothetical protein
VTGSKPIAVLLQSIIAVLLQSVSGVSAINPLVAFYDIHGEKREVLFFYFVPDTTRDLNKNKKKYRFTYKIDRLPVIQDFNLKIQNSIFI